MTDRNGGWITTFTGKRFWPLDPRPEEVNIEDIARALSMQCRFSGHLLDFCSVAQHSVIGCLVVNDVVRSTSELARWFLLHDAAEAYMFDAARPIKSAFPFIKEVEGRLMRCIAKRFDLSWPEHSGVKEIDDRMLLTERRDLMVKTDDEWNITTDLGQQMEPYLFTIDSWTWQKSEREFLDQFDKLFGEHH